MTQIPMLQIKTDIIPQDQLDILHTSEDCFCHPYELQQMTIHRFAESIDTCGPEAKFITGYSKIWQKN